MNIKPMGGAAQQTPQTNPTPHNDARARAIAKLTTAPASPALDQNNISPEELGAIKPQSASESGQVDAKESQVPETAPEAPEQQEETALSRQYAQLARQEKFLRQQAKKAKEMEANLLAREQALKAKEEELSGRPQAPQGKYYTEEQIKRDALKILGEAGLSYDDLTQQVLNQSNRDPQMLSMMDELRQQIQELKAQNQKYEEAGKKSQADQYQAAIKQITTDVNKLVFTDPEFETIKATGSQKDVVDLIERTFQEEGVVLDVEEAAREVEQELLNRIEKLTKVDKIKKRLVPSASQIASSTPAPVVPKQQQPSMKTLTNAASASRPLSARERAIAAFKGQKIS